MPTLNLSAGLRIARGLVLLSLLAAEIAIAATARNTVNVALPPPPSPRLLLPDSPFGINTAFEPDTPDLVARLEAMQVAGIKWGRQDFTWRRIEKSPGEYGWSGYDRLVQLCQQHGIMLVGNLVYEPKFHDPRTAAGVEAYCAFARAAALRYAGQVDDWQIWNEPNGGYWKGNADEYARLLAAAGRTIHAANPKSRVLGLNSAFCDVRFAKAILNQVPSHCFDIACFHPYRPPSAPEDRFDWWMLDQYVKSWNKARLSPDYPLVKMTYLEQAAELGRVLDSFDAPKPLWVTEMCWNTHIHPYGVSELRQADLLVRFYVLSLASRQVDKVFWWTLADIGTRQFDQADMVGLMRADLTPKYAYHAYSFMTRMLEGKAWLRNDAFGPDVFVCVFRDAVKEEDILVAWANRPSAYIRVSNTARGLDCYDLFGTQRHVPFDKVRTGSLPVPLGESPIYLVGAPGTAAKVRPDPGW
jgi:hypothetical protein